MLCKRILSAGCVLYLRKTAVFLFPALILTAAQNVLATIWPLIEILRSPVHMTVVSTTVDQFL